ncbi:MAG: hypothetical protein A2X25_00235 [Chloroflexi bacterium GWB2_49_20]|nr:MAG: hypothetical protein A2X25_00235 [Chloroflexi bacterium GWB2_49_20]OGN76906.1 MAG: hypothetical protein A2X26_13330 [Chloroflexi bacterium GWC2_49_37]OGN84898.1 MAG: hypothetical protein A2X27_15125 [Chloroflexi bacterium GWD2_49_16]HCM96605.1 hypothetical protein [Anaerolineae bacterium]
MDVDQEKVAQFLREFKALISTGRDFDFIGRPENNSVFINLGLTWRNFIRELLGLSVVDYCSGPENDRDRPGVVWLFGKEIYGHDIYIKLKIYDLGSQRKAKCISFHEANHPIRYPFRK